MTRKQSGRGITSIILSESRGILFKLP